MLRYSLLLSSLALLCYCVECAIAFSSTNNASLRQVSAAPSGSSSSTPPLLTFPLTQVVSDIDDTLKSSGGVQVAGVNLGGIDVQYERGKIS
jgi:hypothetical protein